LKAGGIGNGLFDPQVTYQEFLITQHFKPNDNQAVGKEFLIPKCGMGKKISGWSASKSKEPYLPVFMFNLIIKFSNPLQLVLRHSSRGKGEQEDRF